MTRNHAIQPSSKALLINFSLTYKHPGAMQQATFDSALDNITNHGEIVGETKKNHSKNVMHTSPNFIKNPDVVLREEDEDAALLFNPDTGQVKVLNSTGLFIWQRCDGNNPLQSIVAAMLESFDAVPEDQVTSDITEFIDEMTASGFIGIVENKNNK